MIVRGLSLDDGFVTGRTTNPDGTAATVFVDYERSAVPDDVRAYLMVDAYPAARATLAILPS